MSDGSYEYKRGVERGKAGKAEEYGLLETGLFDSDSSRAARRRGFEAGVAARATAEAIQERAAQSSGSSGSSYSSGDDPLDSMMELLLTIPFAAVVVGVIAWLLGTLLAYFGRTVVAAGVKAIGASRPTVERVLASDPWSFGGPIGFLAFFAMLGYLVFKWFKQRENREIFVEALIFIAIIVIAIVIIIGLIVGWQFLSSYTAN